MTRRYGFPILQRGLAALLPAAFAVLALAPAGAAPETQPDKPAAVPPPSATPPAAGVRPARAPAPTPPRPAPRAVLRFEFAGDAVEGELRRPDEPLVTGRARATKGPSLIEIPSSFVAAIARSLEDL